MKAYKAFKEYKKACGGDKEMTYKGYTDFAKGRGMDENDYNKAVAFAKAMDSDDDEDEDDTAEKSLIAAGDLAKSLAAYDVVASVVDEGGTTREAILTGKLREGTISKSERSELGTILAGTHPTERGEPMRKSFADRVEDDDDAELMNASPFLKSLVDNVSLDMANIRDSVLRDGDATRTLLKSQGSLIKGLANLAIQQQEVLADQGHLIKSLNGRIDTVERQPVVRKSAGTPNPRDVVNRVPGQMDNGGDDRINKSELLQGLGALTKSAADKGDERALTNLAHATALLESGGQIHPQMYAAVAAHLGRA